VIKPSTSTEKKKIMEDFSTIHNSLLHFIVEMYACKKIKRQASFAPIKDLLPKDIPTRIIKNA